MGYIIRQTIARPSAKATVRLTLLLGAALLAVARISAQAPDGPMAPPPNVSIQQSPHPTVKVRATLVSTPIVVRNKKDEMVHTLDASDFQITDNGVRQKITHFDLGSDPVSMVVLVENSSRIS
ncbi:MAG: hypothetical protein ABSG69_05040, partial [Candidatus Acidiferrum sp.]